MYISKLHDDGHDDDDDDDDHNYGNDDGKQGDHYGVDGYDVDGTDDHYCDVDAFVDDHLLWYIAIYTVLIAKYCNPMQGKTQMPKPTKKSSLTNRTNMLSQSITHFF